MAFFQSFFDESGKFKDHRVVAFCGFGSYPSELAEFDKQWNYQLRRTGMSALHMVDAYRIGKKLSPTIGPQTLKERINELKPFADCVKLGERIGIMCDDDEETAWNCINDYLGLGVACVFEVEGCYALYRRVKKLKPEAKRSLAALTFANDEHFPALQAADMLSFLCRMEANRQFYGTPYDFLPLFKYLTRERGTSAITWRVAFKDKTALEPLGVSLAKPKPTKRQQRR
jgi:Protein of unknown function (DUF3800)